MGRRIVFALVVGVVVAGCSAIPAPFLGGDQIVMDVANRSARPATLSVSAAGDQRVVLGAADPAIVPPGVVMKVRFVVPSTGQWAIWANGGELMSNLDLKGRRGVLPVGIEIDRDGNVSWWCQQDCP
jgi:hypothetical protein